jgi:O-antigen ligase
MLTSNINLTTAASRAVAVLLLVYPVLLLSVRNGMSACHLLLLAASLAYLFRRKPILWDNRDVAFAVAMSSLLFVTIASEAYNREFPLAALDSPSRFLLAVPVYFALRTMPFTALAPIEYGFPLGVLAGLFTTALFNANHDVFHGTYFLDAPMWGTAILSLAFLSVNSINWFQTYDPPARILLKCGSFFLGLYGAIRTDERGIWIAIPVLGALWAWYRFSAKQRVALAGAGVLLALAAYYFIPTVPQRIVLTQTEIHRAVNGDYDSSMGKRLQIWNGAIELFRKHPILGIGPAAVTRELLQLHQAGWLTAGGLEAGLSQIHNEILANAVRLGIFGILSILAIYFVPFALFVDAAKSAEYVKRTAGILGQLFIAAYFVFGLTIETFNLKMFASFYAVTVAILLAIARHQGNQRSPQAQKLPSPIGLPIP